MSEGLTSKFSGVKFHAINITPLQLKDLGQNGRSAVMIGRWDDGTPAFVILTVSKEVETK